MFREKRVGDVVIVTGRIHRGQMGVISEHHRDSVYCYVVRLQHGHQCAYAHDELKLQTQEEYGKKAVKAGA